MNPIAVDLYMLWLEGQAIATAPFNCKKKIKNRKKMKNICGWYFWNQEEGESDKLTAHLNQIDPTGSIKFTHEE